MLLYRQMGLGKKNGDGIKQSGREGIKVKTGRERDLEKPVGKRRTRSGWRSRDNTKWGTGKGYNRMCPPTDSG